MCDQSNSTYGGNTGTPGGLNYKSTVSVLPSAYGSQNFGFRPFSFGSYVPPGLLPPMPYGGSGNGGFGNPFPAQPQAPQAPQPQFPQPQAPQPSQPQVPQPGTPQGAPKLTPAPQYGAGMFVDPNGNPVNAQGQMVPLDQLNGSANNGTYSGLVNTNGQFGFGPGNIVPISSVTANMLGLTQDGKGNWMNNGQIVGRVMQ